MTSRPAPDPDPMPQERLSNPIWMPVAAMAASPVSLISTIWSWTGTGRHCARGTRDIPKQHRRTSRVSQRADPGSDPFERADESAMPFQTSKPRQRGSVAESGAPEDSRWADAGLLLGGRPHAGAKRCPAPIPDPYAASQTSMACRRHSG